MAVYSGAATDRISRSGAMFDLATGCTFGGWFNLTVDRDDFSAMCRLHSSSGGVTVLNLSTGSSGVRPCLFVAGGGSVVGPADLVVSQWWYVAFTINGTTCTLYMINPAGTVSSTSGTLTTGTPDGITLFGRSAGDPTEWFNGAGERVRMWQSVFTQSEIVAERNSTTPVITSGIWENWPLTVHTDLNGTVNGRNFSAGSTALETVSGPFQVNAVLNAQIPPFDTSPLTGQVWNSGDIVGLQIPPFSSSLEADVQNGAILSADIPPFASGLGRSSTLNAIIPAFTSTFISGESARSIELRYQRQLTEAFIAASPVTLSLIPVNRVQLPSGGVMWVEGEPREPDDYRLIPMSHTERPVKGSTGGGSPSDEGLQFKYDFTLLGTWDSVMEVGDTWTDDRGQINRIDSVISDNGYQRKGLVTSYGQEASHG